MAHEMAAGAGPDAQPSVGSRRRLLEDGQGHFFMPDVPASQFVLDPPAPDAPLVGLIDTGVLANHPLIVPRLVAARDFTDTVVDDVDGHGSEVAITIILTAPNVRILSAKVLAEDDAPVSQQAQRIAAGIGWAVENGARELNLSVGFLWMTSENAPVCAAVRAALDQNVIVAAAGEARCPAACDPRVFVVGELRPDNKVNTAENPTFVAPTFGQVTRVPWSQWRQAISNENT